MYNGLIQMPNNIYRAVIYIMIEDIKNKIADLFIVKDLSLLILNKVNLFVRFYTIIN